MRLAMNNDSYTAKETNFLSEFIEKIETRIHILLTS